MTEARLGSLLIENFRSLNGTVAIPLDAPIVLLHGSNGMGKTSLLSALELALTGQIEHLQRVDSQYAAHLLHWGSSKGSIKLAQAGASKALSFSGAIQINKTGKSGRSLLAQSEAKFFSERCYLPQSALGRLLELYQNPDTKEKTSPLTKFVKDLLGLDQLDAIVDGLHPALNVARIRNLISEYRRFESLNTGITEQIRDLREREAAFSNAVEASKTQLGSFLELLYEPNSGIHQMLSRFAELAKAVQRDAKEDKEITQLTRTRQELTSLNQRRANIPKTLAAKDRQAKERAHKTARDEYQNWLANTGSQLANLIKGLSDLFPSLPPVAGSDPIAVRETTESFVTAEQQRCDTLLKKSAAATESVKSLNKIIQRSKARVADIDTELANLAGDAEDLAHALAGIVPHIHDDNCPVCNRNFSETKKRSLSTHVASSIAALTRQAGKLKDYTQEKIQETGRIKAAEQDLLVARKDELTAKAVSDLTVRKARLDEALQKLASLTNAIAKGSALLKRQSATREELAQASVGDELSTEIQQEVAKWTTSLRAPPIDQFETVGAAITALVTTVNERLNELQTKQSRRRQLLLMLEEHIERIGQAEAFKKRRIEAEKGSASLAATGRSIELIRTEAKTISTAASNARAAVVGRVFNTSLNKMWRDLFVRLAPNEQFVPAFKLPETGHDQIEASLETIHRGDQTEGGPPGTMLSAGNLNTAALTLFLALHLSVARRLPWLILDDPVQSMDDVHISQFAALLRMVSKGLDRQIILAVHDRALFDYLTLELSPAFEDDRLITVELSRTIEGKSVASPEIFIFKPDKAIAA